MTQGFPPLCACSHLSDRHKVRGERSARFHPADGQKFPQVRVHIARAEIVKPSAEPSKRNLIMKAKFLSLTSLLALSTALSACGDINGVPAEYSELRGGSVRAIAGLRADAGAEVVSIHYTVEACDGSGVVASATIPLEKNMVLPGALGSFQDNPLDKDSAHRFSDFFKVLDAGCYNVTAQPIGADELASENCSAAEAKDLNVLEGATTEAVLIVQCETPDPGALDVVTVINNEPRITDIVFKTVDETEALVDGSKFTCGLENRVCVQAHDPDHDPLSFELVAKLNNSEENCTVEQIPTRGAAQTQEQCFKINCIAPGKVELSATVFDMVRNQDKELITFEDYFTSLGQTKTSRAHIGFMTYLGGDENCEEHCPEDEEPKNDGGHHHG